MSDANTPTEADLELLRNFADINPMPTQWQPELYANHLKVWWHIDRYWIFDSLGYVANTNRVDVLNAMLKYECAPHRGDGTPGSAIERKGLREFLYPEAVAEESERRKARMSEAARNAQRLVDKMQGRRVAADPSGSVPGHVGNDGRDMDGEGLAKLLGL